MRTILKKWLKLLSLTTLTPFTITFNGGWSNANQPAINFTNLIVKDKNGTTYNNLPVKSYGSTPWSPMQLDLQRHHILQGRIIQRIIPQNDDIILYATGNQNGNNTKWYEQDVAKDAEPHQILANVDNLDWHYDVKIWHNHIIYNRDQKWYGDQEPISVGKALGRHIYISNKLFIFSEKTEDTGFYRWFGLNLLNSKIIYNLGILSYFDSIYLQNNHLYFEAEGKYYLKNLSDPLSLSYAISPLNDGNVKIINDNWLVYQKKSEAVLTNSNSANQYWYLHKIFNLDDDTYDAKILNSASISSFIYQNKFFIYKSNDTLYCSTITFNINKIGFSEFKKCLFTTKNITGLDSIAFFKGNYLNINNQNFVQRWIDPNSDFNLSITKIDGYGNANKKVIIDFKFNPNWQNKDFYLSNTKYYLNYWVDNNERIIKVPLVKTVDSYQFTLSNDDLINYDGKTLHTIVSANVNGREVDNIKLAQANNLFKYDDVNNTYDYVVKNYTPSYWTKTRIVALGVGCVLAIPFLVALFFWLKRQWHKIYF